MSHADDDIRRIEVAIADLYRLANNPGIHRARQQRLGTELSRTELETLRRVDDLGPVGVSRVASVLGLSLAATSRTLARLEDQGHLARSTDPDDGRVANYEVTASGRRVRQMFQESTTAEVAHVMAEWSRDDRERLAELFTRLVAEMLA